jgi:TRAP-type C4-dicarboxylate transport system substrate-binding protein
MSRMTRFTNLAAAMAVAVAPLLAAPAPIGVKLATLVPRNSLWYNALTDMGAAWTKATEGRVTLTVYEGGKLGDEPTTIKMMRPDVDSINAALLTAPGLAEVDDGFNVFSIPFFFQSDEEARAVRQKLAPALARRLEAKGLHLVNWGHGGWVQIFSKQPIRTIDDVKHAKLFTSQGDEKMVQWYRTNGFNPVTLKMTDMATGLTTGLIDAAPSPAYAASVIQIYRSVNAMLDVRVGPLYGALVVADRVWTRISEDDRAKVLAAGQAMETSLDSAVPGQDAKAVLDMQARNPKLVITRLDDKALAAFRVEAERLSATMRGTLVPVDIYDQAVRERDAFRKPKGK